MKKLCLITTVLLLSFSASAHTPATSGAVPTVEHLVVLSIFVFAGLALLASFIGLRK